MNSADNISNEDSIKLQKLWAIFDIVDRKYEVEHDLRPLSLVQKWVKDEIAEVMAEVVKWDDVGRRDELWDLLYVTYAAKKWRTAGSQEDLLKIFKWHPSFMKYFNELSIVDFEHTFEKFRGRNEYLFDEDFLAELAKHESKTVRMDMIDDAWDLIKYKKQKGFNTEEYRELLRNYSQFIIDPDSKEHHVICDRNIHDLNYLQSRLTSFWVPQPYLTYAVNSFKWSQMNIWEYVSYCEIYIAKWLSPILALIWACFKCGLKQRFVVYWKSQVQYLLRYALHFQDEYIGFVYDHLQFESFLFMYFMIQKWYSYDESLTLALSYASPRYCPIPREFHRKLRPIVERWGEKFEKLLLQWKTPDDILCNVAEEAMELAVA